VENLFFAGGLQIAKEGNCKDCISLKIIDHRQTLSKGILAPIGRLAKGAGRDNGGFESIL